MEPSNESLRPLRVKGVNEPLPRNAGNAPETGRAGTDSPGSKPWS